MWLPILVFHAILFFSLSHTEPVYKKICAAYNAKQKSGNIGPTLFKKTRQGHHMLILALFRSAKKKMVSHPNSA